MLYSAITASALLASQVNGDCYLHYFRGSNNRLNEQAANRNNANRLFDSQNNNRGGYNCCDLDDEDGFQENNWLATAEEKYDWRRIYNDDAANLQSQYEEVYYEESEVSVTWTNQHGTGNKKLLSEMILQFGCDTFEGPDEAGGDGAGPNVNIANINTLGTGTTNIGCGPDCRTRLAQMRKHGLRMELMNGGNTDTPDNPNDQDDIDGTYTANNQANEGRHESEEYYRLCEERSQQYGLFHADQNLAGDAQIYTRQNPAGTRRGLECPEERDYYPWWNPSPWHDIAIITPSMDRCLNHIAPNSQNVVAKCSCVNPNSAAGTAQGNQIEDWFPDEDADYIDQNLNEAACEANDGDWDCFGWNAEAPECVDSYWTKVNYLGNADGTVRGGKQAHYDWTLPSWDSLINQHYCWPYHLDIGTTDDANVPGDADDDQYCVRMVFRIRYNMSTMDYDPFTTNSTHDHEQDEGILSPIEENPEVDVGFYVQGLQLAINTAQTGRTFQDRSHTFMVCKRPDTSVWANKPLINVNVRGKRGNIVQTFPATEYDFEPQHVEVSPSSGTCFHFQWCGSNTHNNGNPGGDGQTGDDGEGRGGSDRSNLVQMFKMDESYPLTYDTIEDEESFFTDYVDCYHPIGSATPNTPISDEDAQLVLGTAGFYKSVEYMTQFCDEETGDEAGENRGQCVVDELLNNVSASFRAGLICCLKDGLSTDANYEKEFAFLSTRNNNFSNRAQKWKFVLTANPDDKSLW